MTDSVFGVTYDGGGELILNHAVFFILTISSGSRVFLIFLYFLGLVIHQQILVIVSN